MVKKKYSNSGERWVDRKDGVVARVFLCHV